MREYAEAGRDDGEETEEASDGPSSHASPSERSEGEQTPSEDSEGSERTAEEGSSQSESGGSSKHSSNPRSSEASHEHASDLSSPGNEGHDEEEDDEEEEDEDEDEESPTQGSTPPAHGEAAQRSASSAGYPNKRVEFQPLGPTGSATKTAQAAAADRSRASRAERAVAGGGRSGGPPAGGGRAGGGGGRDAARSRGGLTYVALGLAVAAFIFAMYTTCALALPPAPLHLLPRQPITTPDFARHLHADTLASNGTSCDPFPKPPVKLLRVAAEAAAKSKREKKPWGTDRERGRRGKHKAVRQHEHEEDHDKGGPADEEEGAVHREAWASPAAQGAGTDVADTELLEQEEEEPLPAELPTPPGREARGGRALADAVAKGIGSAVGSSACTPHSYVSGNVRL